MASVPCPFAKPARDGQRGCPHTDLVVAVDHGKYIRHISPANPGTRNDKTTSRTDSLLILFLVPFGMMACGVMSNTWTKRITKEV